MELYKVGEVGSWRPMASSALSLWHTEEAMQWTDGRSSAHPHCVDRESLARLLPLAFPVVMNRTEFLLIV